MSESHENNQLETLNALLPQTQCRDCGYQGCKPYARAMLNEGESIDRCKPGGVLVLERLANFFSLDPNIYVNKVLSDFKPAQDARIDKEACIGCVKCIRACPIDAVVGVAKHMHEVITDLCSGCGLCVPVCPVDCITLENSRKLSEKEMDKRAQQYQQAYEARNKRLEQSAHVKDNAYQERLQSVLSASKPKDI